MLLTIVLSTCVWIFILLQSSAVTARQEFLTQPTNTEVNPGETAKLECSILNKVGQCVWQKDRKPQGMFPSKYEWNGDDRKGDCSLLIHNATIDIDDGLWECQVTASSLHEKDGLSSPAVRLTVRERPHLPVFKLESSQEKVGNNITVIADQNTALNCDSRYGNPPASIRWFIGNDDITQYSVQKNNTEENKNNLWQAQSTLNYSFSKHHNGQVLRCRTLHEAYIGKFAEVASTLNVQYVPFVHIEGKPFQDIEDSKDSLKLECLSDANPPALITWKKDGKKYGSTPVIQFSPIYKNNSGHYSCEGLNLVGKSQPVYVDINVKYRPENIQVVPVDVNVGVHNNTYLMCSAESNPPPLFSWLFSARNNSETAQLKGFNNTLVLKNVTYKDQGIYFCMASNIIHGEERGIQSEEVKINVYGMPLILPNTENKIHIEKGEDAVLNVPFCSDPPPSIITWEWGGIKLAVGEGKGKYIADQFHMANKQTDCYEARLIIQKVDPSDAQYYMLTIENGNGNDTCIMALDVSEPVSMPAVIGIIIGCLILLVIIVLVILYAVRSEKWCFHKAVKFKRAQILSDGNNAKSASRPGAIPPDALYTLPSKHFVKVDADKKQDLNDLNENKKCVKETDEDLSDSHPSASAPNHYQTDFPEMHFRPRIHEVADI